MKQNMPTIIVDNPRDLLTIIKYVSDNLDIANHTIDSYLIRMNPNKTSSLACAFKKFTWLDAETGEAFVMEVTRHGEPSPHDNIYYKELVVEHDNITALQSFVTKMLSHKKETKIFTSTTHGYWNSFDTKVNLVQKMDSIYIPCNTKDMIINHITNFVTDRDRYELFGKSYKTTILLTGIPGSGKSSMIKAIANMFGRSVYYLNFAKKLEDDVLLDLVKQISDDSILAVEDIDSYYDDGKAHDVNVNHSTILNIIDGGYNANNGLIVIMTANNIKRLGEALTREGRINLIVEFDYPKKPEIESAFKAFVSVGEGVDIDAEFKKFYKEIKDTQISMSGITDYLFNHPKDFMEHIEDELLKQAKFRSDSKAKLYM
jgi:hypothetical protein